MHADIEAQEEEANRMTNDLRDAMVEVNERLVRYQMQKNAEIRAAGGRTTFAAPAPCDDPQAPTDVDALVAMPVKNRGKMFKV